MIKRMNRSLIRPLIRWLFGYEEGLRRGSFYWIDNLGNNIVDDANNKLIFREF